MKLDGLCDAETAIALRFDWLVEEAQPVSAVGRARFAQLRPFRRNDAAAAAERAHRVSALAGATDAESLDGIREALRELPDVSAAIARAGLDDVLTDADLLEILRFCDSGERVATLAAGTRLDPLQTCPTVRRALEPGRTGSFAFYLADAFDDQLAAFRRELGAAQTKFDAARQTLSSRIARALHRDEIATDEFIVMREDVRGALPTGVHVVREAPTYFLCELELDAAALEALQMRDRYAASVARAEETVRRRLSATVAQCGSELEQIAADLGELDVLLAAVRYARRHQCVAPSYVNEARIEFSDARFLPLEHELAQKGREYVPIAMQLARANILTGPNMGGKTVALRTAGFIALCAAFGLPVPARSASVALFERIDWLGIGVQEPAEGLLSSFAREVVRLREALEENVEPALWLIDEFARTTTPDEGRALLLALVRRLQSRAACALIATHLASLGRDASMAHFAVGGLRAAGAPVAAPGTEAALRALADRMDYRIERVTDSRDRASDAIELAALLGLDKELVENAKEILAQWSR